MTNTLHLKTHEIIIDQRFQIRSNSLNKEQVNRLIDAYNDSEVVEAPWVWHYIDNDEYYLIDGFHRLEAYSKSNRATYCIECEVKTCGGALTLPKAIFWTQCNVNQHLTQSLSITDKKVIFNNLYLNPETFGWSDAEYAKVSQVSRRTIINWKKKLQVQRESIEEALNMDMPDFLKEPYGKLKSGKINASKFLIELALKFKEMNTDDLILLEDAVSKIEPI
ncbi:MAG: hypothetical protein R3321_00330 [Nitrososphaeraceae archaeon]|nr:hypothetical protein [Nitrososphaeraceae archaeon]